MIAVAVSAMQRLLLQNLLVLGGLLFSISARAVNGYLELEHSHFTEKPVAPDQPDPSFAAAVEWEMSHQWNSRSDLIKWIAFMRADETDDQRSHYDIRELYWTHRRDPWELGLGIGRENWSVTEYFHLINIINQADFGEDFLGEEKLGQPMVALAYQGLSQRLELWWLPYFRERSFSSGDARLSFAPQLDTDNPRYESGKKTVQKDYALRWSSTLSSDRYGSADIAIAYFSGIARDPRFQLRDDGQAAQRVPLYETIRQLSLSVQWLYSDWLWKLETLVRHGQGDHYSAATGGLEYSFIGVFDSQVDIGCIVEFMYDDRDEAANHFFQNDAGIGLRVAFNDVAGSELLLSHIADRQFTSTLWALEFNRRLNNQWKFAVEAFAFSDIEQGDLLHNVRQDDFVRLQLVRYF